MGNTDNIDLVKEMLLGSAKDRFMFKYTTQSINYVECHDNLTYFDKAIQITDNIDEIKKQSMLALSMVILSQGVPFIHAGQEFLRTKKLVSNSYNSGDEINLMDWERRETFNDVVEFVKQLIQIRKKYPCFKLKSSSELNQEVEAITLASKSIMLHFNAKCNMLIVFKPNNQEETVIIPETYDLLLSSDNTYEIEDKCSYILKDIGTYIFKKR